jgi:hypothetical protein
MEVSTVYDPHTCSVCHDPAVVDGELQFHTTGVDLSDGVILWACDDCVDRHGITSRIRHCWNCDEVYPVDTTHQCEAVLTSAPEPF